MVLIAVYMGRLHGLDGVIWSGKWLGLQLQVTGWFTSKNMDGSGVREAEGVSAHIYGILVSITLGLISTGQIQP